MNTRLKLRIAIALLELTGIAVWHLMHLRKSQTPTSIYDAQEAANTEARYLVLDLRENLKNSS